MAGIAGIFSRDGQPVAEGALMRQQESLAHRARHGHALWRSAGIGLVHCQDDVSPRVWPREQPLRDSSGRYAMVCAGRIFNAREVASQIVDAGGQAPGETILEVMLQAYVHSGNSAFGRFNGAFACAIWDAAEQRLVLARDHLGLKSLYVHVTDRLCIFGSEVKAILAHPDVAKNPDEVSIAQFLTFNHYLFHTERTFYQQVQRVLPAQVLTVDCSQTQQRHYWQIDPMRQDRYSSDEHCVDMVRELMTDAVRIRMPDTPRIGAALTGGFDSSSIVCVMRYLDQQERSGHTALETFSFDFGTPDADEVELIDLVARRVGANHHHIKALTPHFFSDLDYLIQLNDGPILESSIVLLWKKKQAADAAGVNVFLSGLGGDEVFMGTLHYLSDLFRGGKWIELAQELRGMYPVDYSTGKRTSLEDLFRSYVLAPLMPEWIRRVRKVQLGQRFPPKWVASALVARTGVGQTLPKTDAPTFPTAYGQWSYELLHHEVVGGVIPYQDVVSSAVGVETRYPLLDIRLVEALFALPREWKLYRGKVRVLQKKAMAGLLPDEILRDHLKKNFHPTLNRFLREAYQQPIEDLLTSPKPMVREFVDWPVLDAYYRSFVSGRVSDPSPLWGAMNLEKWLSAEWGSNSSCE